MPTEPFEVEGDVKSESAMEESDAKNQWELSMTLER